MTDEEKARVNCLLDKIDKAIKYREDLLCNIDISKNYLIDYVDFLNKLYECRDNIVKHYETR